MAPFGFYLPVIDLLKAYFHVEDHDDPRQIRDKVTARILALDRALEPNLSALLALLDVPVDDDPWQKLHWLRRRRQATESRKCPEVREVPSESAPTIMPRNEPE